MARIRSFSTSQQDIRVHRTEVECEFKVVWDGAEPYLNLSTFGSDDRASERKSSQNLQLDAERARQLVEIIEQSFPTLRRL